MKYKKRSILLICIVLFKCVRQPTFSCEPNLGNAEGVSAYKKSYHQFSLNNLIKIESSNFILMVFFFFFFFLPSWLNIFPMQGFHRK